MAEHVVMHSSDPERLRIDQLGPGRMTATAGFNYRITDLQAALGLISFAS